MDTPTHGDADTRMQACIDACLACHAECLRTMRHCLGLGGMHASKEHISLLAACAAICATSADTMLIGAMVHAHTCGACAAVCRQCAKSCEAMGNDARMQLCADTCRQCADQCEAMSVGG
jgi:hypothetical protein